MTLSGRLQPPLEPACTSREAQPLHEEAYSLLIVGSGTIGLGLELHGYRVAYERFGGSALERIEREAFDALILDMRTSELDGLEVCRRLRKRHCGLAVFLLLPRPAATLEDAFEAGADGCLVGTFAVEELLARLRAILRRTSLVTRSDGSDA